MEADAGMRYSDSVSSARQTRSYLREFGHRREVILRVLAADSIHAAWSMRRIIRRHLAAAAAASGEELRWTIRGAEQLDAAAELMDPVYQAMAASLLLLGRLAGGFWFGPAVALVHAAVPLPEADATGPGGLSFGVFERPHDYTQGEGQDGLARAVGRGGFASTIARVLLHRPSTGLAFADEADAVDAEGGLETLLLCARALRRTDCAPLRAQALALAPRIMDAYWFIVTLGANFSDMRRLTHRRSRRSCRVAWASYFDRRFEMLQRDRFAAMQLLHTLGVHLLTFASQRLEFPPPPIA